MVVIQYTIFFDGRTNKMVTNHGKDGGVPKARPVAVYRLLPGRNKNAAAAPNTTAAVMPPAAAPRGPVKTPSHPCSATAFSTPVARVWPKPVRGTVAPARPSG